MKNYKKKDSCRKCIIDPDCIECDSIKECCHDECRDCCDDECQDSSHHECCDPCSDSIVISTLPCREHIHRCDSIIAEGRGEIKNDDTDLEFKFRIIDNHGCFTGDVAVADYNNDILLSSDNLQSFSQCTSCSFCAVFCDFNRTKTRYIILCGLKEICGRPAELFVFSPPFCGVDEVSTGGSLDEGFIKIADSESCC